MAMTERRYTDEEVAEIFRPAPGGAATSRCPSRFPPTLSLRSRKIAEARVAIQMHECLGRANARLTTAPLRHDLVMLPPNALTILADMRKQRGLFFLDR